MSLITRGVDLTRLGAGILFTTVGALSVHVVMLQCLHVPFPELSAISPLYKFSIRVIATIGLIVFWQLASENVQGSFFKKSAVLFLCTTMLTETLLRGPFMDAYCTKAWAFIFIANSQKLLTMAISSLMIVAATPKLPLIWQKLIGGLVITFLVTFIIDPWIGKGMAPVMKTLAPLAPQGEWCTLPYGPNVLIPAYLTFLEPVLASLAAAALIWDRLSASLGIRFAQFTVLILAIKNLLVTPLVYALLANIPFLRALSSVGQFALEAAALALLTGITWEWSATRRSLGSTKSNGPLSI